MRDARRTMHTAHSTAKQMLGISFKSGGKDQTFKWLTELFAQSKYHQRLYYTCSYVLISFLLTFNSSL